MAIENNDWLRAYALLSLAKALADAERFDEARAIALGIEYPSSRTPALHALASALCKAGYVTGDEGAFATFGVRDITEYIRFITEQWQAFEQLEAGLGLRVLREVLRVACWVRPSWREVYTLLADE